MHRLLSGAAAVWLIGLLALPAAAATPVLVTTHRGDDDLLSAGLGLAGLRTATPPALADPQSPTPAELRRRAIWSNWRGIADVSAGGGIGEFVGEFAAVPGSEHHALLTLPSARQPHRVLLQLPDVFLDDDRRCLLVAAASGSRSAYGAIALAGGWGLPRGCAVVHTDKGAGSGWVDGVTGRGMGLDGRVDGAAALREFTPAPVEADPPRVLLRHAHSGDNPEADWGRHVEQAARFAIDRINVARGERGARALTPGELTVIAVGVSNGGGAVLRAAERGEGWLDGVVAVAPNIWPGDGGRALFDVATEAALWMPCAFASAAFDAEPLLRPGGAVPPAYLARCASLARDGRVDGGTPAAQAEAALQRLQSGGWTGPALVAASLSVNLDLWRAVAAAYAAAHARSGSAEMPCGYAYARVDGDGRAVAPTASEVALWWSDSAGIPPALGVALLDAMADGDDPAWPGLRCLRGLWEGEGAHSAPLREGVAATRAALPPAALPVLLMHGLDDGLVVEAFTAAPYAAWLRAHARPIAYWRLDHVQHFDAFLGNPALAARWLPLLPYAWHGLDVMWAHLTGNGPAPADAQVVPRRRAIVDGRLEPLQPAHLALP